MSVQYLLDTNIISEPLRPRPNRRVLDKLRKHQAEVALASVVWHELLFGSMRLPQSKRRDAIESYLYEVVAPSIAILPYDENAAKWHASERARLTTIGRTPSFADGQIAATAVANDLALVTANSADYEEFEGLRLISWHRR